MWGTDEDRPRHHESAIKGATMFEDWSATVAIASIALGCTVYYTAQSWFAHRERMAKIERGIDPDSSPSAHGREPGGLNIKIQKGVNPEPPLQ